MKATAIIAKANGGNHWAGGDSERVYVTELLKTPHTVSAVFVVITGDSATGSYGYTEETDCGTVVVKCTSFLSKNKKRDLQAAIWALLDD